MKARFTTQCGRCRETINPGAPISRVYGAVWHLSCVLTYQRDRRALAASGK